MAIGDWVGRLGSIWVEGQVAQITRRPGMARVFLTLRDPAADVSLQTSVPASDLDSAPGEIVQGSLVVVSGRPTWYHPRGTLTFEVRSIRLRGEGELWAQIERRKRLLAAEGVFDQSRKKPLPFLPRRVGLICGRASAAEHDVLATARRRWPGVEVEIRNVPVQGPRTVPAVRAALAELDAAAEVDVIVIARGGGSIEDLLPFSDEGLIRAVVAAGTPVVAAIGHETDNPLLDLAADVRASTPTDAARRIVPDVIEETESIASARRRLRTIIGVRLSSEAASLRALRDRDALRNPAAGLLAPRHDQTANLRDRSRRALHTMITTADHSLHGDTARLRTLSPAATLERGYAIVQTATGAVVRDAADVERAQPLRVRLHHGHLDVDVAATHEATTSAAADPSA